MGEGWRAAAEAPKNGGEFGLGDMTMKTAILGATALLLAVALPAQSQDLSKLPDGCKKLIAETRACAAKVATDDDTRARINHMLDMMADNISHVDEAERKEACQVTIVPYRQMAGLTCATN